ncbi:MAG: glycoside hydrolase family 32 protein [Paludibacter sp.]|nr:glycoside hydrolase family 32 protein [Paludibacter sp.]
MKFNISIFILWALLSCSACGENGQNPEEPTIDVSLDKRTIQEDGAYQIFYKTANDITGDPMPYYNEQDKTIYVFYLSTVVGKSGVCLTKTTNFASFGVASNIVQVGGTGSWDTGIGTGSCIKNGSQYVFFYTGFSNQSPSSVVLKAVSNDMRTWTKVPSFRIEAPNNFDRNEFRDPCVYFDDTRGKYVMLVGGRKLGKASIVRFESADLNDWQAIEPLTATTSDNPQVYEVETDTEIHECPDIFKMGDKWYLVFSRINRDMHRKTYYRIADNPNGPWKIARDADGHHETFDGLYLYAGKTSSDGTARYVSGWASTGQSFNASNELDWGGCLVTHEIVQQSNGKLYPKISDAVDAKFSKSVEYKDIKRTGNVSGSNGSFSLNGGKVIFNRNAASVKIEMTINASQVTKNFGIAFGAYENQQDTYDIKFDLTAENQYGLPTLFLFHDSKEHNFTPLIVPQNKIFNVKIIIEKSICAMYINNNVAFTNRITNMNQNPWMIFANEGTVKFSDIKIYKQ